MWGDLTGDRKKCQDEEPVGTHTLALALAGTSSVRVAIIWPSRRSMIAVEKQQHSRPRVWDVSRGFFFC